MHYYSSLAACARLPLACAAEATTAVVVVEAGLAPPYVLTTSRTSVDTAALEALPPCCPARRREPDAAAARLLPRLPPLRFRRARMSPPAAREAVFLLPPAPAPAPAPPLALLPALFPRRAFARDSTALLAFMSAHKALTLVLVLLLFDDAMVMLVVIGCECQYSLNMFR